MKHSNGRFWNNSSTRICAREKAMWESLEIREIKTSHRFLRESLGKRLAKQRPATCRNLKRRRRPTTRKYLQVLWARRRLPLLGLPLSQWDSMTEKKKPHWHWIILKIIRIQEIPNLVGCVAVIAQLLLLDEPINCVMSVGHHVFQEAVKSVADGQYGESDVVD